MTCSLFMTRSHNVQGDGMTTLFKTKIILLKYSNWRTSFDYSRLLYSVYCYEYYYSCLYSMLYNLSIVLLDDVYGIFLQVNR